MNDTDRNQQVIRQYVEAFNNGDVKALRPLFTDDAVIYGVLGWGAVDVAIPIWSELHDAIALKLTVEDIVCNGDHVAVRFTERGAFKNPFRGQPPTGRSYEVVAMEWFLLRDGKIQRRWGARDSASMCRQTGLKLG
jgi:steroid delta-isomerase-like uncharacterized protein